MYSTTSRTLMRVPRMMGSPPQIASSLVILLCDGAISHLLITHILRAFMPPRQLLPWASNEPTQKLHGRAELAMNRQISHPIKGRWLAIEDHYFRP